MLTSALLRKQWLTPETKEITPDAYYLRKQKKELGLSVNIASNYSFEQCAARFKNCYGVASLNVGEICKLGLDVIPDSYIHANIIGLPYPENDPSRAERLPDLLVQIYRLIWTP